MDHPKLTLLCRILSKPDTIPLTNGEYRTQLHLQANGGEHHIEVISLQMWANEIILRKTIQLELDVTMNNEHILIYQNPVWHYL